MELELVAELFGNELELELGGRPLELTGLELLIELAGSELENLLLETEPAEELKLPEDCATLELLESGTLKLLKDCEDSDTLE